jgi:CBS domain-containing protein
MKLAEIMTRDPEWIRPETSLEEAACRMRELDTGFIPVGDGDRLRGIITDRDIAVRAVAEGLDTTTPVEEVMTQNVVYCFEDQDVRDAADLMAEKQVRRMVVLDRNKNLTGIISLGDICVRCGDEEMVTNILDDISQSSILAY